MMCRLTWLWARDLGRSLPWSLLKPKRWRQKQLLTNQELASCARLLQLLHSVGSLLGVDQPDPRFEELVPKIDIGLGTLIEIRQSAKRGHVP